MPEIRSALNLFGCAAINKPRVADATLEQRTSELVVQLRQFRPQYAVFLRLFEETFVATGRALLAPISKNHFALLLCQRVGVDFFVIHQVFEHLIGIDKIHIDVVEIVQYRIAPIEEAFERHILSAFQRFVGIKQSKKQLDTVGFDEIGLLCNEVGNSHDTRHYHRPTSRQMQFVAQKRATPSVWQHEQCLMEVRVGNKCSCHKR